MTDKVAVLFLKAASIPAGARWITVHPNGKDSKGQPVLIQETAKGSGAWHVVGGAGGKLNYLKLRGVKSEEHYKQEAGERQRARREERKEQVKRDKQAGVHEAKQKARESVVSQRRAEERAYVDTVASAMGWDRKELDFDEQGYIDKGLSDKAINKLRDQHHRAIMERAQDAVDLQRRNLMADAEARADAGLGEVPIDTSDAGVISVADLDNTVPRESASGLGFSADYKGRAEEAGLTEDELKGEVDVLREEKRATMTDAQRQAAIRRGDTAKQIRAELEGIREEGPKVAAKLVDGKKAAELLKAEKRLKAIQQKARTALKDIESSPEPKAYVLEYTADPDEEAKVNEDILNDLRTVKTRAFLSEIGRHGPGYEKELGRHIGVGAFNSVNALALAVSGDALVDRSVVDVLGVAGAAEVLARRVHASFGAEDAARISEAMEEFHLHHYMQASQEALREARELQDRAKEIELGAAATGADIAAAQELNARRRDALSEANRILGQSLGEMEANAALVVALKRGRTDKPFQVSLGDVSAESAIQQARAIGLERGDYRVETVGSNRFLTVTPDGMDRLSKPVNREDLEQVRRNLDIMGGKLDEDGWMPKGVANRPDLDMRPPPGVAPRLSEAFEPGQDLAQSLRDYIGGRTADGEPPADIIADIQSADFFRKVGPERSAEYLAALNEVAPLKGEDGKQRRAEELGPAFESMADQFVGARFGGARSPLHRQQFAVDQKSTDALHRALTAVPEGTAAYKAIGDLTSHDQRALREFFYQHVARESPEEASLRAELEQSDANEPARQSEDMFGEVTTNPEWTEWKARRDELAAKVNAASLSWGKYIEHMGGNERAYEAVQDLIRSHVSKAFADAHNTLNPGAPLKVGRTVIRNNLRHLDLTDPSGRDERLRKERDLIDSLRERDAGGRYAAGAVADKLDAARAEREAFEQSQMGFFATEELPEGNAKGPAGDERYTLGQAAEQQIAGMMGRVGANFKPGQPIKLWNPSMSGGQNYARQRAIRLIDANKRVGLAFGVGSGKTLIGLAAFTHLHEQGKAKRGLYLVPSIVQGQFGGEALRYLEPGKYNWHAEPGASREDRIAAYKDPSKHFAVMTHQAFRDDMIHLAAKHEGVSEADMTKRIAEMKPDERRAWMKGVLDREGINFDYLMVDEGHDLLNRAGKENSGMANVIDSFSAHTPYYVSASGDPIKNDPSEAFDLLAKMDPARYMDRDAFMRRYGVDTMASRDSLRRELARYIYPSRIDPSISADRQEVGVSLSSGQRKSLDDIEQAASRARIARMEGRVDVDAVKALSPSSFDGVPEEKHEGLARELQANIGILKNTAINSAINAHPESAKIEAASKYASDRKGKPGVIFAHSREAVKNLSERLAREGHRVVEITGSDSAKEKERKRQMFHPESGEPEADILIASDAAAVGMNIQRGQWLLQYDTPMTAKTHAQRQGRINRIGQKNNVELADLIADHPSERKARDRLKRKYALRELMTSPLEGLDDTGVAYFLKQKRVAQQQGGLF